MMDAEDRRLFAEALTKVIASSTGAALDDALADLGWAEALDEDRPTAVSLLFELQGTANVTSSALDVLLANAMGVEVAAPIVLLPRSGTYASPTAISGGRLTGRGLARSSNGDLVVVAGDLAVAVPASSVTTRPISGMDPQLRLASISVDVSFDAVKVLASEVDWPSVVAVGQLAIAHEIVGACRTMLRLAREHALEREQFGQRISAFQAIRHRLAESLVAIEAADSALAAAWQDGSVSSARYAKAIAGTSARTVARHAQQVLAGMGYTTEHAFHLYLRRVLVLDQVFGASRSLTREIGEELLQARALPPMLPL
jgi:hypothetical protein